MFLFERDIHFLNSYQINSLLNIAENNIRQKVLLLLMLDAGLRVSETISLKLNNFDFKRRTLTVLSLKKRNKVKMRQIPLSERLFLSLAEYIKTIRIVTPEAWLFPSPSNPENHICRSAVNQYLKRKNRKINIRHLHPHALRHTFATSLISNKTLLNEIADLLGHESLDTTRIYTHIPTERLRHCVQRAADANEQKRSRFRSLFRRKLPTVYIPAAGSGTLIGRDSILQQITGHIEKGTNICLLGDTGTGKKTLLDALQTTKKVLTLDDTGGIKKSLVYLLIYLYENNMEAVKKLFFADFDTNSLQTKLSRQTVGYLCDEIKKITSPKQFILKIKSIENITSGGMRAIEALKDHFIIITSAKEVPINKASFLWNFEKIKIGNLSRSHAYELIHKLSYDLDIEDYELYRNHIMEQTAGNPRAIVEIIERYRREPVLVSEVIREITHRGPVKDIDFSFVVVFFIASLAVFRYMTSEFDNPGLRVIGGISMILLLLSRSVFAKTKRRYL